MRMTMLQYAIMAAAAGMPALAPVVGSLDQIQAGARAANQVSQYCAPPQENTEAPKFYCRQYAQRDAQYRRKRMRSGFAKSLWRSDRAVPLGVREPVGRRWQAE